MLPLTQMLILFKFFDRWMRDGLQVELVSRCLFFALRMYHDQLSAARMQGHGALIESLLHHTRDRLSKERDTIGFNIAGIRHLSVRLLFLCLSLPVFGPIYALACARRASMTIDLVSFVITSLLTYLYHHP